MGYVFPWQGKIFVILSDCETCEKKIDQENNATDKFVSLFN